MAQPQSVVRASWCAVFLWCALAVACDDGKSGNTPGSFESDIPSSAGGRGLDEAGSNPTSGGARDAAAEVADSDNSSANHSADRAIAEADVIQLDGNRLYALSRVAGLAVVDASDPSALKLLGRYRELSGSPFEMYLRGDVAILMFTGWSQYEKGDDGSYSYVTTSKVVTVDVADPTAIASLGTFDVPGSISDSRIVGDVLYVAGYEDGYCWRCEQNKPTTTVSSLNLADPREMRKVDQLRYADTGGQWSWQRSITVTNQRMYVAGPEYGNQGPIGSTIQVIDISDAAGDLVPGATLEARGQISSRWQMDEYDGVLRVVSQSPAWRTTELPQLQTFKIISSKEFQPLAKLDIVIPARESLQSARFDGPRGYLITAERTDPLFTLDLSDPAKPKQVGELVMPGFVYHMEPRGDRVLGLGFDQGNPEGSITVSLFDVSDFASPKMLSRVNFGGDWGSLPEDQDRIHKVFRVLPDEGLILVPFMGYERSKTSDYCGGRSVGGVQLVDYANDTLRRRGSASSEVEVRRALVHNEHLLAVSDQRVESFTMADRDALTPASTATISSTVRYAAQLDGDKVARVVSPDWGQGWYVELTSTADAENIDQRLGVLDLASVFETDEAEACNRWWSIESYHAEGSTLYLLYTGYRASKRTESERETGVIAIDASNPAKPRIAGRTSWIEPQDTGGWSIYYGGYSAGFHQATPYLWHDGVLAFFEQKYTQTSSTFSKTSVRLRVVDLHDPAKLATSTLALGDNREYTGLLADGDQLLTTRADSPRTNIVQTRIKFYADRFDVSKPSAPKLVGSANVPGIVVYLDRDTGRAVTSQMHRVVVPGLTSSACYSRFSQANFDYTNPNSIQTDKSTGTCTGYTESLELIALHDDAAVLEDSLALKENQQVLSWSAGDGRLFATLGTGFSYYPAIADCAGPCGGSAPEREPVQLLVLSGFGNGKFQTGRLEYKPDADDSWRGYSGTPSVVADGDKALLIGDTEVAIVDASDAKAPKVERTVLVLGYAQSVEVENGTALLALGEQGLQWIEF